MPKIKKIFPFIFILFLSFFSIKFLLKPGFFPMHDNTQVTRVFEMKEVLKSFQFPARWVAHLGYGYGYPIFNFYNPLPYYFGGLVNLLGLSSLTSTKLMFIIAVLASGLTMYLLAKEFFGQVGGITSGLFYLYAPYHAVQIYVRGAVAEIWAYALLPFIFLFTFKLYKSSQHQKDIKKYMIFSSFTFAALILSHNLSVLIWFPPFVFFIIPLIARLNKKVKINFLFVFFSVVLLGLGLSCFFWLPALMEKNFTSVDYMVRQKFNPLEHFVFPDQLWFAFWGYGGSVPGRPDGLSFQVGKIHLLFVFIAVLVFVKSLAINKKLKEKDGIILFFLLGFLFSLFMMIQPSKIIWQALSPFLIYLQFPWRFLSLASFFSSFLAGSIFLIIPNKKTAKIFSLSLIIVTLIFINFRYFQPLYTGPAEDKDLLTEEKIKWEDSFASDEYLPPEFPRPQSFMDLPKEKFVIPGRSSLSLKLQKPDQYTLEVETPKDNFLTVNIVNFPGWRATLDGKKTPIINTKGVINIFIPQGKHLIDLSFKNTPRRTSANFISIISFMILLLILFLPTKFTKGN